MGCGADALQALPLPLHVRRLRGGGGRVQGGHRATAQIVRHEMVSGWADILAQRCQGRDLAAAPQPDRSGLTRHLTTARTQTTEASPGYPPVTYILVPHPTRQGVRQICRGRRVSAGGWLVLVARPATRSPLLLSSRGLTLDSPPRTGTYPPTPSRTTRSQSSTSPAYAAAAIWSPTSSPASMGG